jgi:C4-dicarboxylate-specific signal transduction histidine kinase
MISIAEIVDACVQRLQEECARHAIELRVNVGPDIPLVLCRQIQMEQIVSNLLNNAVEAIVTSDSPERWICMRAGREENSVYIDVTDSAAGIHDVLDADLVTPAYFRNETRGGLYIGLGLSRMIAEDQHGSLSLLDRSGTSCFRLSLPILLHTGSL